MSKSPRTLSVAAIQCSFTDSMDANLDKATAFIRDAAALGAQVILLPELFQGPYFCTSQDERWFANAYSVDSHPCVTGLQKIARELGVVLPVSFFERDGNHTYNSVAMVDHLGSVLGVYRKSHIPDGPGYQEKYYFRPGNSGFKVWPTVFGRIGVGICWDQWYPECARSMMLQGAEILLYPTAIGSEPHDSSLSTLEPWRRAMQGHAVSNVVPVVAANRIGTEQGLGSPQAFYGHSFIADHRGDLVASFGDKEEGVLLHSFDLDFLLTHRSAWGFFRDRRPDLYSRD